MPRRAIVFGARGMLGSKVSHVLQPSLEVVQIGRGCRIEFVVGKDSLVEVDKAIGFCESDVFINCLGWIPQKSNVGSRDRSAAVLANALFPAQLSELASERGSHLIQIGTDCVFSGNRGAYSENDKPDAFDLYGRTKVLGEFASTDSMILRSSIVGLSANNKHGLLEWFLSHEPGAQVTGYLNQFWNGVTTNAWAKVVKAVIELQKFEPLTQHLVPKDSLSKFELLKLTQKIFQREDVLLSSGDSHYTLDRTLTTSRTSQNVELWKAAGYDGPPTIEQLLLELKSEG